MVSDSRFVELSLVLESGAAALFGSGGVWSLEVYSGGVWSLGLYSGGVIVFAAAFDLSLVL